MALATGLLVASLYYAQPLLATLAQAFRVTPAEAGWIVTLTQLGYALGLLLIVPLGDLLDRRRLTLSLVLPSALALLGLALSGHLLLFLALSSCVGLTSVSVQILVPFAASLAPPHERGRVVGTVMSGLLLGILLARTFSGLVAQVWSWQAVYLLAAFLLLLLALLLSRSLPHDLPKPSFSYWSLLSSIVRLVRSEPLLRWRSLLGALVFAAFNLFWTSFAFLLSRPPYHFNNAEIGLFGLVGAAGALSASLAGRLADRGLALRSTFFFALTILVAFFLLVWDSDELLLLILSILILDFGIQGLHITNQTEIYSLPTHVRSRVTTVYLTTYFLGGAAGSWLSTHLFTLAGWRGVMGAGLLDGLVLVLLSLLGWRGASRSQETQEVVSKDH